MSEPARLPSQPLMSDRRRALEAALVHQHDDGLDAAPAQLGHQRVDGVGLVAELEPGHAGGRDDGRRGLERHADEGHRHAVEALDAVGRQQRAAGGRLDHVGRQPLELRAVEAARRAEPRPLQLFGSGTPSVILQPPFCRRSSSAEPLSNSWLPTALNSSADPVQRLDRRLVEEQRRDQRRRADEVARADHHVQRVLRLQLRRRGRPGTPRRRRPGAAPRGSRC